MKTKEELELMSKDEIIRLYLESEKEYRMIERLRKFESEERMKLSSMLDAVSLILNNRKR